MKSQLTDMANQLASRGPPGQPVLNYADPALRRDDKGRRSDAAAGQGWRRLGFGFGLGMILLGFAYAEWPHREETLLCTSVGGFLFGVSIPGVATRRTFTREGGE